MKRNSINEIQIVSFERDKLEQFIYFLFTTIDLHTGTVLPLWTLPLLVLDRGIKKNQKIGKTSAAWSGVVLVLKNWNQS